MAGILSVVEEVNSHAHIRRNRPPCVNHFCKVCECVYAFLCVYFLMFVPNAVRWLRLKLPFNLTESIFISSVGSYY